MILKVIGGLIIVSTCYLMGEVIYMKCATRIKVLKEFYRMGLLFKANIRHTGEDICEIMREIKERVDEKISVFLEELVVQLEKKDGVDITIKWDKAIEEKLADVDLMKEDIRIISRFGEIIGYLDKQLQIENVELFLCEMEEKIKELSYEIKEKGRLCKTLSIALGIFIVLLVC